MNARFDFLPQCLMDLSAEDRTAAAAVLIDSLETTDTPAVSDSWRAEVLERRGELRAGTVKGKPWAEVRARLAAL